MYNNKKQTLIVNNNFFIKQVRHEQLIVRAAEQCSTNNQIIAYTNNFADIYQKEFF